MTSLLTRAAKHFQFKTFFFYAASLNIYLILSYLVLAPAFDLLPAIGPYNEKRLLACFILLLAGFNLIFFSTLRTNWITLYQHIPVTHRRLLATFIAIGLLSALLAIDPPHGLLEISVIILLFISCLLIALQRQQSGPHFDVLLTRFLLLICAVNLTLFFTALIAANIGQLALSHLDFFKNFAHIRFFSQFQSWTLPLIVLPLLLSKKAPTGMRLWLPLLLAGGWWFLLFSSGSRGSLLGLSGAAIITAFAFGRSAFPWFKWQMIACLIGLCLYFLLFILPPLLGDNDVNVVIDATLGRGLGNSSGRSHLWQVALNMIAEHPWLGIGPMHYACGISSGIAAHPHNTVLQIAAEWGIPAALIVIFLVISGALAWIRQGRAQLSIEQNSRSLSAMLYPALLASLVTATIHAQFSGIIIMPLSQLTMILIIGWMLGIYFNPSVSKQNHPIQTVHANRHIFTLILASAAAITLLLAITQGLSNFDTIISPPQYPDGTGHFMPRFWQQGLFCDI